VGTIFLDEIGNVPLRQQAKLLRVIESGEMERVGSSSYQERLMFRVISGYQQRSSGRMPGRPISRGPPVPAQYGRVHLPALRERREDIPALAMHFLSITLHAIGGQVHGLEPSALQIAFAILLAG